MFKMSFFFWHTLYLAHREQSIPYIYILSHILPLLIVDMMSCDLAEDSSLCCFLPPVHTRVHPHLLPPLHTRVHSHLLNNSVERAQSGIPAVHRVYLL